MDPWYQVLFLVGSNVFMIPIIILCFWHKIYDIAGYSFATFFCSTVYHLAQTSTFKLESLEYAQNADHFFVNSFFFSVILLFLQMPIILRSFTVTIMQSLMITFIGHLVARLHFHYAFTFIAVFGFFVRFYVFPGKRRRYGIVYVFTGALLWFISLVFFFFNDGVGQPNYWWAHSGWHMSGMIAATFIIVGYLYHVCYVWNNLIGPFQHLVEY